MYRPDDYSERLYHSIHDVPGRALGIWSFVLSFFVQVLAIVFGVIALNQSRRAGISNRLAVAGIAISVALLLAGGITTLVILASGGFAGKY